MPGDWIKFEKTTQHKKEVYLMANLLGETRERVVLGLITVWSWFDSECANCDDPKLTECAINALAGVDGFTKAMVEVGWLEPLDRGYRIPNFERHLSKSAKRRALHAENARQKRDHSVRMGSAQNAHQSKSKSKSKRTPLPPRGKSPRSAGKSKTKTAHTTWDAVCELLPPDSELRCAEFEAVWSDWVAHRREIKKPLTPTTVKAQLKELDGMGLGRAVAMIRHTVAKGWQGLREPDGVPGRGQSHDTALAEWEASNRRAKR